VIPSAENASATECKCKSAVAVAPTRSWGECTSSRGKPRSRVTCLSQSLALSPTSVARHPEHMELDATIGHRSSAAFVGADAFAASEAANDAALAANLPVQCLFPRRLGGAQGRGLLGTFLVLVFALLALAGLASADSLWDGESPEFWQLCKECTSSRRVFCFTTGTCLDLDIDAPSQALWGACMNPLLVPQSCKTKGIHPPGTPREVMENWDRGL